MAASPRSAPKTLSNALRSLFGRRTDTRDGAASISILVHQFAPIIGVMIALELALAAVKGVGTLTARPNLEIAARTDCGGNSSAPWTTTLEGPLSRCGVRGGVYFGCMGTARDLPESCRSILLNDMVEDQASAQQCWRSCEHWLGPYGPWLPCFSTYDPVHSVCSKLYLSAPIRLLPTASLWVYLASFVFGVVLFAIFFRRRFNLISSYRKPLLLEEGSEEEEEEEDNMEWGSISVGSVDDAGEDDDVANALARSDIAHLGPDAMQTRADGPFRKGFHAFPWCCCRSNSDMEGARRELLLSIVFFVVDPMNDLAQTLNFLRAGQPYFAALMASAAMLAQGRDIFHQRSLEAAARSFRRGFRSREMLKMECRQGFLEGSLGGFAAVAGLASQTRVIVADYRLAQVGDLLAIASYSLGVFTSYYSALRSAATARALLDLEGCWICSGDDDGCDDDDKAAARKPVRPRLRYILSIDSFYQVAEVRKALQLHAWRASSRHLIVALCFLLYALDWSPFSNTVPVVRTLFSMAFIDFAASPVTSPWIGLQPRSGPLRWRPNLLIPVIVLWTGGNSLWTNLWHMITQEATELGLVDILVRCPVLLAGLPLLDAASALWTGCFGQVAPDSHVLAFHLRLGRMVLVPKVEMPGRERQEPTA